MLSLPDEQWAAIEHDLAAAGWTLEDVPHRLPWMSLFAFVLHLPRESAYRRLINPDGYTWSATNHLIAELGYRLDVLIWQSTKDGNAGRNQPQRWERPGVTNNRKNTYGSGAIPVTEWDDWWNGGT